MTRTLPRDDALTAAWRIRVATAAGRRPVGTEYSGLGEQALLRLHAVEAAERADAARCAARLVMRDGHGCTGITCTSARHAADTETLRLVLAELGTTPVAVLLAAHAAAQAAGLPP